MLSQDVISEESGLELFLRLQAPWLFLKIKNCCEVNALTRGGFAKGEITEFVGNIAVGKTQLCFSVVASLLLEEDAGTFVVYMDTNGSFRSIRLRQILISNGVSSTRALELMSRVLVCRIYNGSDLSSALSSLQERKETVSLVVIDSFGAALAETTINYIEGGKEEQEKIINCLRSLIKRLGCAVLTTNHFVYWRNCPAPSLGQKWISAVDSRYLLAKLPDCYYVQLIHSRRCKLTNERALFQITERGIESFTNDNLSCSETQAVDKIISSNWDTVMQIYSQTVDTL